jgi:sulfopropanediol 3-dehydrogenase
MEHIDRIPVDMPTCDMAGQGVAGPLAGDRRRGPRQAAVADTFASEHVEVLTASPSHWTRCTTTGAVPRRGHVRRQGHRHQPRTAHTWQLHWWALVGKYLSGHLPEATDPASSAAPGELCGRASSVEPFEGHARSGDVRREVRHVRAGLVVARRGSRNGSWLKPGTGGLRHRTHGARDGGNGLGRTIAGARRRRRQ